MTNTGNKVTVWWQNFLSWRILFLIKNSALQKDDLSARPDKDLWKSQKLKKKKCFKKKHSCIYRGKIKWRRKSRRSTGYVNPSGISTHPACYCVCVDRKRATAEEGLNHPWLNSHPHQHPNPHLHSVKASSLDEPETSQSESEPESPACSPELDLIGSFLLYPGQGELKTGRPAFSFSEPPFATRPEIQQELICWERFQRPGEAALTPRSRRLIGAWSDCCLALGLLPWLPVLLCVLWGGLCVCCFFWYFCVCLQDNLCWSMIARKEWKAGERARKRWSGSSLFGKRTEADGNGLKRMKTASFLLINLSSRFPRGDHLLPQEMTSMNVWSRRTHWWVGRARHTLSARLMNPVGRWQTFVLAKRLKAPVLAPPLNYSTVVCFIYLRLYEFRFGPQKSTRINATSGWKEWQSKALLIYL